ncbi:MAG: GatB/YqeY domain-containing protein [Patescibacteria group bacterium]|nr:GatB/YqeY domain-containing protein [Patescibacteria group bacterium]
MDILKSKIENDFKSALKQKKELEVSVLRMLKADIFNKEKEKRYNISKEKPNLDEKELDKKSSLEDEDIEDIVFSKMKKSKESIAGFEKGERQDLVGKEQKELEILKKYIPEQLSEQEVEKIAKQVIEKIEAKDIKDMGKVMSEIMIQVKGKADGSLVSKIIRKLLS